MKQFPRLCVVLTCFALSLAQGDTLLNETFTTDGDTTRYQDNFGEQASGGDIFNRVINNLGLPPASFDGAPANHTGPVIAGSDIEMQPNAFAPPNEDIGILRFAPITITDTTSIQGTINVACAPADEDRFYGNPVFIKVQYAVDGNVGPFSTTDTDLLQGNYTTVLNIVPHSTSGLGLYVDGNPANQKVLGNFNPSFSFSIPATGNTLSLQVSMFAESSGDEFAFDNVIVTATPASTPPPALPNIETAALSYSEGEVVKQITASLTVSDANSPNLTGGTVSISSGFAAGDQLAFVNQNGISGVFAGGVLTLSGTASLVNYRTALRSVKYHNTNAIKPSLETRTISFQVTDEEANDSGVASRNIELSANLAVGSIPFNESFESNNESITYISSTYDAGADYFERHSFATANPYPQQPVAVVGVDGNFAWAAENVASAGNPLGSTAPGIIRFQDLNATGLTDIEVHLAIANTIDTGTFENTDKLEVQIAFDGNRATDPDLTGGSYTTVGRLVGNGVQLQRDSDLNGTPNSVVLSATLQDFTFSVSGSGNLLSVRIVDTQHGGSEEHVFDNLRVTGTLVTQQPSSLWNIEGAALIYTEGDPATVITSPLTTGDSDDTHLEGATIKISQSTYVSGEDVLLFANQNGISGVFTGGTMVLSGSATLANYQTALRSVRYGNTNVTNPNPRTRAIEFPANDGEADSNTQSRDIPFIRMLASPTTLPFCESFETDGEGVRYASNTFFQPDNGTWFRTSSNPAGIG